MQGRGDLSFLKYYIISCTWQTVLPCYNQRQATTAVGSKEPYNAQGDASKLFISHGFGMLQFILLTVTFMEMFSFLSSWPCLHFVSLVSTMPPLLIDILSYALKKEVWK